VERTTETRDSKYFLRDKIHNCTVFTVQLLWLDCEEKGEEEE